MGGAGGAPSEGVILSLKEVAGFEIIGMGADLADLYSSAANVKVQVPYADDPSYSASLEKILSQFKPDFVHFQNDSEILIASSLRHLFDKYNVAYFMPRHEVIETCVHKYKSYLAFANMGIKVPKNILICEFSDLKKSFDELRDSDGQIWLRSTEVGGGGIGSLATSSLEFAKAWIDYYRGWGKFLAAEKLTEKTVTWQSIWKNGQLIVAQTRLRDGWIHSNRAVSGITGVTKVGITYSSKLIDEIAAKAVYAVDGHPNGIYGVDMAFDSLGIPNPTEINISRFFTTIRFFTTAGLNMPEIYVKLGLNDQSVEIPSNSVNPLMDGLFWIRGMDRNPILATRKDLADCGKI